MLHKNMPIGAAIAALKREVADRQSALAILEALLAPSGQSAPTTTNGTTRRRRKGKRRGGSARLAVEIIRAAGRPMHGLTEIIPALEARGLKFKNPSGLATALMRTGEIERTAPGTFGLKDGSGRSNDATSTKN